ncbi:hypothetical protein ACFV0R_32855 [Streptomyces sp. NPDC059578]|uniref:hypothetical protein n=1 Tax=unclassified Streptomyces TaxID=2593676 RepID=UPI00365BA7C5
MVWVAMGSAVIGLGLALAVLRLRADRLPAVRLVLTTGVVGALFGAFVTRTALGDPGVATTLFGAATLAVALLSLLLRPHRVRRSAPA